MSPSKNEILGAFNDEIRDSILAALGEDNVLSMFVIGSVARGEAVTFAASNALEVYSDLDLCVVVSDDRDPDASKRLARQCVLDVPLVGEGYVFFSPPDVGVFSHADLMAQRPRPGTVEISASHVLLHGDGKIPNRVYDAIGGDIPADEALYLIENRLNELAEVADRLESEPDTEESADGGAPPAEEASTSRSRAGLSRYAAYVALKSGLDLASASLIALGRYHISAKERMKLFLDEESQAELAAFAPEDMGACVEDSRKSLARLKKFLTSEDANFAEAHSRVENALTQLWKGIAQRIYADENAGWDDLIARRCGAGMRDANVRQFLLLGRRMALPRAATYARAIQLAFLSPLETMRLAGLVEAVLTHRGDELRPEQIEHTYTRILEGLSHAFHYSDGNLFQRGRAMFKAAT